MKNTRGRWIVPLVLFLSLLIGVYDIFFRNISLVEMTKWTGVGLLLNIGGLALIGLIRKTTGKEERDLENEMEWKRFYTALAKLPKRQWCQLVIATLILEELIFRGPLLLAVLFLDLSASLWIIMIIGDGLLFGAVHYREDSSLSGFFARSCNGIILSWLVISSGSLIPSLCLHLVWSGFLLAVYRLGD